MASAYGSRPGPTRSAGANAALSQEIQQIAGSLRFEQGYRAAASVAMAQDGWMRWVSRLRLRRSRPRDELAQRLETANEYAAQLTEAGSRCHRNEGRSRFCHWRVEQLEIEFEGVPEVVIRCSLHGGRYLDHTQRAHWSEFRE